MKLTRIEVRIFTVGMEIADGLGKYTSEEEMKSWIQMSLAVTGFLAIATTPAFAEDVTGVLKIDRLNRADVVLEINTGEIGTFLLLDSVDGRVGVAAGKCLNKESRITYRDRGRVGLLLSVNCD